MTRARLPDGEEPSRSEPVGSMAAGGCLSDAWGDDPAQGADGVEDPLSVPESARYERGLELGRGGMGRVVTARDRRLGRQVALKEVRPGVNQSAAGAQLVAEAQLAAGLDHPGIVAIHDAGRDPRGQPWYAMRLVRGQTLTQAARALPTLHERLRLMQPLLAACHAVAHAHERQIVHRDLKPDNLLVGPHGETQVADWGLACTLAHAASGGVVGTAGYMAPEVAAGQPASPRSDVFSLGVTLVAVLHSIDPGAERARLAAALPPELRAITERCLDPDPLRRYPDAAALAEDLSAWLDGRRVAAHSYSAVQLLARLVRAFRLPLLVAAVALVIVAAVAWQGYLRTVDQRDRAVSAEHAARTAQAQAEGAHRTAQRHLAAAYVQAAESAEAAGAHPEAETLSAAAVALEPSPQARGILAQRSDGPEAVLCSDVALPPCRELRFAADGRWLLCLRDAEVLLLHADSGAVRWRKAGDFADGAISSDAARVLLSDRQHHGWIVNLDTGATVHSGLMLAGWSGQVAQRGSAWAAAYNYAFLELIDLRTGSVRAFGGFCSLTDPTVAITFEPQPATARVACLSGRVARIGIERGVEPLGPERSANGRSNASALAVTAAAESLLGTMDGRLWRAGRELVSWTGSARAERRSVQALVTGPEGTAAAVAEGLGPVVWLGLDEAPVRLPARDSRAVAFVDARTVVVAGERLRRWELRRPAHPARLSASSGLSQVAVSPDARWIVAGGGDGMLTVWQGDSGKVAAHLKLTAGVLKSLDFSPDGQRLAVGLTDAPGTAILQVGTWHKLPAPHAMQLKRQGYFANGLLWRNPYHQILDVLDLQGRRTEVQCALRRCVQVELSANTTRTALVYSDSSGGLALLEQHDPVHPVYLPSVPWVAAVALSADGRTVAVAEESRVRLLDVTSRRWLRELEDPGRRIANIAFTPDDRLLLASELDGTVRAWTVADGVEVAVLRGHSQRVAHLSFGPEPVGLLTASWDATIRGWDLARVLAPAASLPAAVDAHWGLQVDEALRAPMR